MLTRSTIKQIHLATLVLLAIACVATLFWLSPTGDPASFALAAGVGVAYALAERFSVTIRIPGWAGPGIPNPAQPREIRITVTEAPHMFGLLVLGPASVLPLCLAAALVTLSHRRTWRAVVFNTTLLAISSTLALALLAAWGGDRTTLFTTSQGAVALAMLVVLFPLWDAWAFSVLIVVRSGKPYAAVVRDLFGPEVAIAIVPLAMGVLGALAWQQYPPLLTLALLPVVFAYWALRAVANWNAEHAKVQELAQELQAINTTLDARVQERTHEVEQLHELRVAETTETIHDLRHRISALDTALDILHLRLPPTVHGQPSISEAFERTIQTRAALYTHLSLVLDAVQLQSGLAQFAEEAIEMSALLTATTHQLTSRMHALDCTCTVIQPAQPLLVLCDRSRLERVFFNLLENAAKFAADAASFSGHQAVVEVWFSSQEQWVGCHISDNGPGIAAEEVQRLGERGVRLGADPRRVEGNGLGLSFCFRAVAGMGGRLEVESPGLGLGSTFTVWLPGACIDTAPSPADGLQTAASELHDGAAIVQSEQAASPAARAGSATTEEAP